MNLDLNYYQATRLYKMMQKILDDHSTYNSGDFFMEVMLKLQVLLNEKKEIEK